MNVVPVLTVSTMEVESTSELMGIVEVAYCVSVVSWVLNPVLTIVMIDVESTSTLIGIEWVVRYVSEINAVSVLTVSELMGIVVVAY